jgi:hypothetical protein
MSNKVPVPCLGTQGWVLDPSTKMDLLLSHFFLADYNQTQLYPGTVISLPRIMQKTGGEVVNAMALIKDNLKKYLINYYDDVNIDIKTLTDINLDPRSRLDVELSIQVIEKEANLGYTRLLKTNDSRMSEIVKINNY